MKLRYLLDTDWAIDYLQGKPAIVARVRELLRRKVLGLSFVSLGELYEGVIYSREPARRERMLRQFLRSPRLLPLDRAIVRTFGSERGRLRQAKKTGQIGDLDILIAATALRHDLTLLTNNRRHFEHIQGLRMESLQEPD